MRYYCNVQLVLIESNTVTHGGSTLQCTNKGCISFPDNICFLVCCSHCEAYGYKTALSCFTLLCTYSARVRFDTVVQNACVDMRWCPWAAALSEEPAKLLPSARNAASSVSFGKALKMLKTFNKQPAPHTRMSDWAQIRLAYRV